MSEITELLERFRNGGALLASTLSGLTTAEIDFRVKPDKWTIRQLVAHLADSELVTAMRYRQVIAEENPTLPGYDQELWASKLDYAHRDPAVALVTFRQLRAESYALMKDLPEAAFERAGLHTERGPQTLLTLLRTYTDHAEKHAEQICGIRVAFAGAGQSE